MVSWLTRIAGSSGCSILSLPLTCCGEYRRSSSCCTWPRTTGWRASLGGLGARRPAPPPPGRPCPRAGLLRAGPGGGVGGHPPADRRGTAAHPPPDLTHRQAALAQPGHLIPLLTIQVAVTVGHSRGPVPPAHLVMQPVGRALRHAGRGPGLIRAHPSRQQIHPQI